jgi:hypothetical protein
VPSPWPFVSRELLHRACDGWTFGVDVTNTQGNTEGGVRHILDDLRDCWDTPFPSSSPDWVVVDWLNTVTPGTTNFEVFLTCMASEYNGCGTGCSQHWNVREKYRAGIKRLSLGGCGSFLGAPITNEQYTPDGVGAYNHFQGGSIYWTDATGAVEVHGAIRDHWAWLGWETSAFGYPISDEYYYDGTPWGMPGAVAENEFEHGWISYAFDNGQIYDWPE